MLGWQPSSSSLPSLFFIYTGGRGRLRLQAYSEVVRAWRLFRRPGKFPCFSLFCTNFLLQKAKMDKVLNREESMELMDLLGLDRSAWGNIPVMRKAYLKKCKELHPDKGGDEDKMKRMNFLYKKMEQGVKVAHQPDFGTWNSSEVGCDFPPNSDTLYCKEWPNCATNPSVHCPCLMCMLKLRHRNRKFLRSSPLVWIDCYCFDCFRQWFGCDLTQEALHCWEKVLGDTPYRDLKL